MTLVNTGQANQAHYEDGTPETGLMTSPTLP